jgi:hypothetical protein
MRNPEDLHSDEPGLRRLSRLLQSPFQLLSIDPMKKLPIIAGIREFDAHFWEESPNFECQPIFVKIYSAASRHPKIIP